MAKKLDWLVSNLDKANILDDLTEEQKTALTHAVVTGYQIDEDSRSDWKKKTEDGLKIAEQIVSKKDYPWPDAANVKFPLIATAGIQFAARAYPAIINGTQIVKAQVVGEDKDGRKDAAGKRVKQHLNYQLTQEMTEWDEDMDKLLHILPVVGNVFKKTHYSRLLGRNVSELVGPLDLVVNESAKTLDLARRVTHLIHLHKNDIIERERDGVFGGDLSGRLTHRDEQESLECLLEQHRWFDLDGDGYEEPYIVTVHEETQTLVRVTPRYEVDGIQTTDDGKKVKRIEAVQYFTHYGFIPAPSGKFYYLGFAHLLGPINESINTILNQLLDAGSLANLQSGFLAKGLRFQGGALRFKPGEWKPVDVTGGVLKDSIYPLPVKEPSNVLYLLLGLLNETGMKLASVSESMTGEAPPQNTPAATTLAMIEQGLKVFTAIYKRVYRSLTREFRQLFKLNYQYLDEQVYFRVLDTEFAISRADYDPSSLDIFPVADPTLASEAQKIAKSQALMATLEVNPSPTGKIEILRQHYEAIDAENLDKLLPEEEIQKQLNAPPPPDPALMKVQLEGLKMEHDDDIKAAKLPYELELLETQIDKAKAEIAKISAEIAAMPVQNRLEALNALVDRIQTDTKLEIERIKAERSMTDGPKPAESGGAAPADEPGGVPGMGELPVDPEDPGLSGPDPRAMVAEYLGEGNAPPELGGGDGAGDGAPVGADGGFEPGAQP